MGDKVSENVEMAATRFGGGWPGEWISSHGKILKMPVFKKEGRGLTNTQKWFHQKQKLNFPMAVSTSTLIVGGGERAVYREETIIFARGKIEKVAEGRCQMTASIPGKGCPRARGEGEIALEDRRSNCNPRRGPRGG